MLSKQFCAALPLKHFLPPPPSNPRLVPSALNIDLLSMLHVNYTKQIH